MTIKCRCKTIKKAFQCNETTPKLLETPIDCSDKCDLKKNKSLKKTNVSEELKETINPINVPKSNKLKTSFEENYVLFIVAFLSLFFILISIFLYFFFN